MTPLEAVDTVQRVQGWLSTLSWIGLVGGVALLIYLYYLALERLGDVAEHALEPRVTRRTDQKEQSPLTRYVTENSSTPVVTTQWRFRPRETASRTDGRR